MTLCGNCEQEPVVTKERCRRCYDYRRKYGKERKPHLWNRSETPAPRTVEQTCVCGQKTPDKRSLITHRETCTILRLAVIGDIVRVANKVGKRPTHDDYARFRCDLLPSWTTLRDSGLFDTWNEALMEARLK